MTRNELIHWVRRKLGHPMVRVELHDTQIIDCLNTARAEYIKWAIGRATEETYFTIALSADVDTYDLPSGVTEVIKIKEMDFGASGGINTLFSTQNYMFNKGMYAFLDNLGSNTMIDYHMALDFMELLDRYTPSIYNWKYNRFSNTIKLSPTPELTLEVSYIILQSYMVAGTDETTTGPIPDEIYNFFWNETWIQDYTLALAKITLGLIRRKFSSFNSVGNIGISLDGDSLVSEGNTEKEMLETRLRTGENDGDGWPIIIG